MKLPSLNVVRFKRMKAKLADVRLIRYVGRELDGDDVKAMATTICAALPPNAKYEHVEDSCRVYVGRVFTGDDLDTLAASIAGNVQILAQAPVYRWSGQTSLEWSAAQIVDIDHDRGYKNELGFTVHFDLFSGSAAGESTLKFWSNKSIRFGAKMLGFNHKVPFQHAYQLVGLYLFVQLDPAFSSSRPGFRVWDCTPQVRARNRSIAKSRFRIFQPCPQGRRVNCHVCPVGYESCNFACHPRTFVVGQCVGCNQKGYFDPIEGEGIKGNCIACRGKGH